MRVYDEETRFLYVDLHQLIADYWNDVDTNHGNNAPDFYTEDCILEVGSERIFTGKAGIREFYQYRKDRGPRTTCHNFSNLRVLPEGEGGAYAEFIVVNYAADGSAPITDLVGPSLVSTVSVICKRQLDRSWCFAKLAAVPQFVGSEPYTKSVLVDKDHEARTGTQENPT